MFLKIKSAFRLASVFVLSALLLNAFAPRAFAQDGTGTLTGVITDESGPVIGAAVFVKDTNNGVTSDFDMDWTGNSGCSFPYFHGLP